MELSAAESKESMMLYLDFMRNDIYWIAASPERLFDVSPPYDSSRQKYIIIEETKKMAV